MATLQVFFLVLAIAYLVAQFSDSGGRSGYRSFRSNRRRRGRW